MLELQTQCLEHPQRFLCDANVVLNWRMQNMHHAMGFYCKSVMKPFNFQKSKNKMWDFVI